MSLMASFKMEGILMSRGLKLHGGLYSHMHASHYFLFSWLRYATPIVVGFTINICYLVILYVNSPLRCPVQ